MSMSLQSALQSSLTSLQVLSQQSALISNNIANANTTGYEQEDLQPSEQVSAGVGSGVMAGEVQRLTDQAAAESANQANGAQAYSQQMVNLLTQYTQVLGQPSDSTSLPSMLSAFNAALTTLSSTPSDATAQDAAVTAAGNLADTLNGLEGAVASARQQADAGIESGVQDANAILNQIAQNQANLQSAAAQGQPTASYLNTRDQLVSQLSNDLPVQVLQNGTNGITITTDGGTTLYDGQVHQLSFTPTPNLSATTDLTGDAANQVTVDGQPIAISQSGSIAANLQARDQVLPQIASQLDQFAGNLISGFQSADPTVGSGQTGLFVDSGTPPATGNTGLAGTIAVNPLVDPAQGGEAWRIQSGVQATTQGNASDTTVIDDFIGALSQSQSYTATGLPSSMSPTDAASQIAGLQQSTLTNWTSINTARTTQAQTAQTAFSNATGVNVDDQMQKLLIVQQTYQASAQVIQVASTMMNSFLTAIQQA
jgi:flagellar hook-associated protein 1 FlgK